MKGMVFRSFEGFVSDRFGDVIVDQVMSHPDLSTGVSKDNPVTVELM